MMFIIHDTEFGVCVYVSVCVYVCFNVCVRVCAINVMSVSCGLGT